ncbi:Hypothetical_protein [Hexamita inflata]|uniref:Hypothetical_protein n=1 Tax=Hexamita inflata TaxID=28002 RepID=A0AA86ULW8_9EUKA|nr:Hypothetical protein HINF_LOCUS31983 [Hexamita inflata]CAI9964588.1 Hypothetical protein HINF_LOCUS52233 [Hexamita inflata]
MQYCIKLTIVSILQCGQSLAGNKEKANLAGTRFLAGRFNRRTAALVQSIRLRQLGLDMFSTKTHYLAIILERTRMTVVQAFYILLIFRQLPLGRLVKLWYQTKLQMRSRTYAQQILILLFKSKQKHRCPSIQQNFGIEYHWRIYTEFESATRL